MSKSPRDLLSLEDFKAEFVPLEFLFPAIPGEHSLECSKEESLGALHSSFFCWFFLLPGVLGPWDCVWSAPGSGGDAHARLALAPHPLCPPTPALCCPVFCRYSSRIHVNSYNSHSSAPFCDPAEGNQDSFELSGGVFCEITEIMTKKCSFNRVLGKTFQGELCWCDYNCWRTMEGWNLVKSGLEPSPI